MIEIATARPIVGGLIRPLSTQVFDRFSPLAPATSFSAHAGVGDDARANLAAAETDLARILGPARAQANGKSLQRSWESGPARLQLIVWPADMQTSTLTNPAHKREPRLKSACSLTLETGFRQPLSARERAWLASFVPLGDIDDRPTGGPAEAGEIEFVREPSPASAAVRGRAGRSADREALLFGRGQLYVVPVADIVGFRLQRILPGRGPGGSRLEVEARTGYAAMPRKILTIAEQDGQDGLDTLADRLAAALGRPLTRNADIWDD